MAAAAASELPTQGDSPVKIPQELRNLGEIKPETRQRVIRSLWPRVPDGALLEKDRGLYGVRTPNALVWGHTLDEICYIPRIPAVPHYFTIYSRSQIRALGENYSDDEFPGPLRRPRVRRPWPVLKLPRAHPANTDPPMGAIDEGSDEEHAADEDAESGGCRTYTMRWDEFSEHTAGEGKNNGKEKARGTAPSERHPQEPSTSLSLDDRYLCTAPSDPAGLCTGIAVRNEHGRVRIKASTGYLAYDYLWCQHFQARLQVMDEDSAMAEIHLVTGGMTRAMCYVSDLQGVFLYGTSEEMNKHIAMVTGGPGHSKEFESWTIEPNDDGSVRGVTYMTPEETARRWDPATHGAKTPVATADANDDSTGEPKGTKNAAAQPSYAPSLFSTKDLPKLEEFIPEGLFPDILLVHDWGSMTNFTLDEPKEPIKYKRVYPVLPRDANFNADAHVAHLHLRGDNIIGRGNHSRVFRAPLTLPPPLSARSRTGQCTVAAKVALPRCTAHRLLRVEGAAYARFPRHVQEEYCGLNIVPPCRFPVPVGAVVPKFFGYYLPVDEWGEVRRDGKGHEECWEDEACEVRWRSPILLMEECGEPIRPEEFSADQRTECFSLLLRLHTLGICAGSFAARNVVAQPGPLAAPPAHRSRATPSFRLIDFGRATHHRYDCPGPGASAGVKEGAGGEGDAAKSENKTKEQRAAADRAFSAAAYAEHRIAREVLGVEETFGF